MAGPSLFILLSVLAVFQLEHIAASQYENKCTIDRAIKNPKDYECCYGQPCGIGGGDCDGDAQCQPGLKCGTDNCQDFDPRWGKTWDCCYVPEEQTCTIERAIKLPKDYECCKSQPCGLGGGDCDGDAECAPGLKCGGDNCQEFDPKWGKTWDCCELDITEKKCTIDRRLKNPKDYECCKGQPCGLGGGDCDGDDQCMPGLKCGTDNCNDFDPKWGKTWDCCEMETKEKTCTIDRRLQNPKDYECCKGQPCDIGGGDCDGDAQCKPGLKCGTDNCNEFDPRWGKTWDCCEIDMDLERTCTIDRRLKNPKDYECCKGQPCGIGGGDCDGDAQCKPGLKCGTDNCNEFDPRWGKTWDCCVKA